MWCIICIQCFKKKKRGWVPDGWKWNADVRPAITDKKVLTEWNARRRRDLAATEGIAPRKKNMCVRSKWKRTHCSPPPEPLGAFGLIRWLLKLINRPGSCLRGEEKKTWWAYRKLLSMAADRCGTREDSHSCLSQTGGRGIYFLSVCELISHLNQ